MRKFTFDANSLAILYSYGLIYIVAGIFDFMSVELRRGNVIVITTPTIYGSTDEQIIHTVDELLNYYSIMIQKVGS